MWPRYGLPCGTKVLVVGWKNFGCNKVRIMDLCYELSLGRVGLARPPAGGTYKLYHHFIIYVYQRFQEDKG
jgi:hypothetical protein